jgi:maleate isomerase
MAYAYNLTDRIGKSATLGLIVLQADETVEHELHRLLAGDGVSLMVSRVPSGLEVTGETLAAMEGHLSRAAELFPQPARFHAVGYACTSGAAVIGPEVVADRVRQGCATAAVSDPVTALVAACRALGITRLGLLSPYVAEVSARLRDVLAQAGIATPVFGSFEESEEARVARIDGASVIAAARNLAAQGGVEGLFLSCTNLRTLDVIPEIETVTGLPVLSSNLVLGWHLARLSGRRLPATAGRLAQAQ